MGWHLVWHSNLQQLLLLFFSPRSSFFGKNISETTDICKGPSCCPHFLPDVQIQLSFSRTRLRYNKHEVFVTQYYLPGKPKASSEKEILGSISFSWIKLGRFSVPILFIHSIYLKRCILASNKHSGCETAKTGQCFVPQLSCGDFPHIRALLELVSSEHPWTVSVREQRRQTRPRALSLCVATWLPLIVPPGRFTVVFGWPPLWQSAAGL